MHAHDEEHDLGLAHDLGTLARRSSRRQVLKWIGGAGLFAFVGGCIDSGSDTGPDASTDDGSGTCSAIPEETAGPYPGDGSNGANALAQSGVVRSDIRTSFASASGTAQGVLLTIKLRLVNTNKTCAPLAGYAIHLWHCDRDGNYSLYSQGVTDQNYLRGVQETDANGEVTFTSIFPGCYAGRWPHIHFEIFPSVASATSSASKLRTSQLALPKATCDEVYATTGYSKSVSNLSQITLASDNVFSDGSSKQVATVTGSVSEGYAATLDVGITA